MVHPKEKKLFCSYVRTTYIGIIFYSELQVSLDLLATQTLMQYEISIIMFVKADFGINSLLT